ncbi:hypothetical protein QBC33DRAFT_573936 [Phialemonium atrogriseum]|uniref:Uncharacterized protein n=1 Tax=Phialemonium atrogriseum TaxID=1093897 RepID=A0AAJ0BRB7_9PEZI|nr:uncharacterized protein QBC33DRAFT_573936 [Phialemonium atrogriseum]KAK1762856.1 hypothetical protein QBC33DRAFT_573936 [Phialemonium atrogriseum]
MTWAGSRPRSRTAAARAFLWARRPGPNEAVVNVGYCFQRRTNDTLRSVGHRVRAPAGKTKGELLDSLYRNHRLLWKPR